MRELKPIVSIFLIDSADSDKSALFIAMSGGHDLHPSEAFLFSRADTSFSSMFPPHGLAVTVAVGVVGRKSNLGAGGVTV